MQVYSKYQLMVRAFIKSLHNIIPLAYYRFEALKMSENIKQVSWRTQKSIL